MYTIITRPTNAQRRSILLVVDHAVCSEPKNKTGIIPLLYVDRYTWYQNVKVNWTYKTKDHKINVGNNRHDLKIQTEFQQYTQLTGILNDWFIN